jgi:hypothetical protein
MTSINPALFLILSGNRCGSTWLTFMLNALPDVRAEFEFQWADAVPSELHVAMKRPGFDLQSALTAVSESGSIRGSKMVFAGSRRLSTADYTAIRAAIPDGIKVVHLSRNYFDSFLSKFRNAGHMRNREGVDPPQRCAAWLVQQPTAWYRKPQHLDDGAREAIDPDVLIADLTSRLANEEFCCSLAARAPDYMIVDYVNLASRFEGIARHVGSQASQDEVQEIVLRQPTSKLPPMDYSLFIANFTVVAQIGAEFEIKRQELLTRQAVRRLVVA